MGGGPIWGQDPAHTPTHPPVHSSTTTSTPLLPLSALPPSCTLSCIPPRFTPHSTFTCICSARVERTRIFRQGWSVEDAASNRLESTSHDRQSSCVTTVQLKQTLRNGKSRGSDRWRKRGKERGRERGERDGGERPVIPRCHSSELEFSWCKESKKVVHWVGVREIFLTF